MSLKVGDIDLAQQSANNEYRILELERLLELVIERRTIEITGEERSSVSNEALLALGITRKQETEGGSNEPK
ncbi:MAG: hypothetical protein LBS61_00370 [Endomicrobium sp.]|jgi:hypothetical protein|nr:hypothetical protein [Endomicrobium sp.]